MTAPATRKPWMKFYPADWRADPRLRMCSVGARGLWLEMMCLMHEATPYGSLLVNDHAVTVKQLAPLVGISEKEAYRFLAELDRAGVFSRDDCGVIFSRRMKRDHVRSEEGREQVNKRWANRSDGDEPNRPPNRSDPDQPITPETRDQRPERISSFSRIGKVKRSGYTPPKHGAYMEEKALVYFHKGTSEWEAHSADFRAAHGHEPVPDRGGGYWFKMKGEAAA